METALNTADLSDPTAPQPISVKSPPDAGSAAEAAVALASTGPEIATVPLDVPIKRADQELAEVKLRRPQSRELEGLNLRNLRDMDASAAMMLIPRISEPQLLIHEVLLMDPSDLFAMAAEIQNFLLPKAFRVRSS